MQVSAGCVNGHNLPGQGFGPTFGTPAKSVEECKALCLSTSGCQAFEYGVAYGLKGEYRAGDCVLQDSQDTLNCDGTEHNLDLYVQAPAATPPPAQFPAVRMEVGTAEADHTSTTVEYRGTYAEPVIIAGIPTENGDEEVVIRITEIAPTSFTMYADVPNHAAGQGFICGATDHASEQFSWMILSAGEYPGVQAGTLLSAPHTADGAQADISQWYDVAYTTPISDRKSHAAPGFPSRRSVSLTLEALH